MASALEIAQLLERNRMAQVQVGRRRVHPELDSQRFPVLSEASGFARKSSSRMISAAPARR